MQSDVRLQRDTPYILTIRGANIPSTPHFPQFTDEFGFRVCAGVVPISSSMMICNGTYEGEGPLRLCIDEEDRPHRCQLNVSFTGSFLSVDYFIAEHLMR